MCVCVVWVFFFFLEKKKGGGGGGGAFFDTNASNIGSKLTHVKPCAIPVKKLGEKEVVVAVLVFDCAGSLCSEILK